MKRIISSNQIQVFRCPRCYNRAVYDADRDVHRLLDIENGDIFICEECGSEFEGSLGYSGLELVPAVYDEEW